MAQGRQGLVGPERMEALEQKCVSFQIMQSLRVSWVARVPSGLLELSGEGEMDGSASKAMVSNPSTADQGACGML